MLVEAHQRVGNPVRNQISQRPSTSLSVRKDQAMPSRSPAKRRAASRGLATRPKQWSSENGRKHRATMVKDEKQRHSRSSASTIVAWPSLQSTMKFPDAPAPTSKLRSKLRRAVRDAKTPSSHALPIPETVISTQPGKHLKTRRNAIIPSVLPEEAHTQSLTCCEGSESDIALCIDSEKRAICETGTQPSDTFITHLRCCFD